MRGTKIWLLGGLTALVLSGCGLLPGTERTETEEVHVGDTVSTSWFDYTITSAQSADSYQARAADEGCKLIVVELTIQNRFDEPVPMYDSDFQLYWGEYAQDQWALPLETYCSERCPRSTAWPWARPGRALWCTRSPTAPATSPWPFWRSLTTAPPRARRETSTWPTLPPPESARSTVLTRMNRAAGFAGGPQFLGNTPRLPGRSMLPRPEPETPGRPRPAPPHGTG